LLVLLVLLLLMLPTTAVFKDDDASDEESEEGDDDNDSPIVLDVWYESSKLVTDGCLEDRRRFLTWSERLMERL